jgi:hypothetical protein
MTLETPGGHMAPRVARWPHMCLALICFFRSHVAIWPFSEPCGHLATAENDQPRKNCSWLIKSPHETVISWPGLALGLSEDFIRPDGHMATWSLKEIDGHMARQRSKWRRGPSKDGQMAPQRARCPHGKGALQRARWPHGPSRARWPHGLLSHGHMVPQVTWPFNGPDGFLVSESDGWPYRFQKGQMATWLLQAQAAHGQMATCP